MLKQVQEGTIISLYVVPNAPKNEIIGPYNGALKIKIKSPPVDGKANKEIINFFSSLFGIAKNRIEVLKGEKNRTKKILVSGIELSTVSKRIQL